MIIITHTGIDGTIVTVSAKDHSEAFNILLKARGVTSPNELVPASVDAKWSAEGGEVKKLNSTEHPAVKELRDRLQNHVRKMLIDTANVLGCIDQIKDFKF